MKVKVVVLSKLSSESTLTRTTMWRWPLTARVFVSVSVTRQQPRSGTVSSNGGPGAWERFARSGLKAPVPMVPELPAS